MKTINNILNKKGLWLVAFYLLSAFVGRAQYHYLGGFNSLGVPEYLESVSDVIDPTTLSNISVSLPEGFPVPQYNPQYIASGTETDIKLIDSADVWVTFVDEGAGYRNVLGFYTYDLFNPPASVAEIQQESIIFPNVSKLYSGGGLLPGNKVHIGTFPPNTGIGWILIANAWSSGQVGNGLWKLYSNPDFNPEPDANDRFHNVMLVDSVNERIILGFEDIRRDYGSCDQDFNDALFYITANPFAAMVTENFNAIVESSSGVGTGGNGGLESNGDLAGKIAERNHRRTSVAAPNFNEFQQLLAFNDENVAKGLIHSANPSKSVRMPLVDLLPKSSVFNASGVVSTPVDLLSITNAEDVFSVDYIRSEARVGAAMAMYTEGSVYEHTKAVCDRLIGAEIIKMEHVEISGMPFILFQLKQANGEVEYAVNFVAQEVDETTIQVLNHWSLDAYPSAMSNYNFQVWSSSTSMTIEITEQILNKLGEDQTLILSETKAAIPSVYVAKGSYSNGFLNLNVVNNSGVTQLNFNGTLARTETSEREGWSRQVELSGSQNEVVSIQIGPIFDLGFDVTSAEEGVDVLYTADGSWGLDHEQDGASIAKFAIETPINFSKGTGFIERDIEATGRVRSYVSAFRFLSPAGAPKSMTNYNALQFELMSTHDVELTLVKAGIQSWKDQFRTVVSSTKEGATVTIFYSQLSSATGEPFTADDLVSIVFALKGDGQTDEVFELSIGSVEFLNLEEPKEFVLQQETLNAFPNPALEETTITFEAGEKESFELLVYTLDGRLVKNRVFEAQIGRNQLTLDLTDLESEVYLVCLESTTRSLQTKLIKR